MKLLFVTVLFSTLYLIMGCSVQDDPKNGVVFYHPDGSDDNFDIDTFDIYDQIEALEIANPSQDAIVAFEAGNYRLVGVLGFALRVPGLEELDRVFINQMKIKVVQGTSDFGEDELQGKINRLAISYAREFNGKMIALLTAME